MEKKEGVGGLSEQILSLKHENELFKQELLVQGELLEQEILERKGEVGRLKIEIETLKQLLDQYQPGFLLQFEKHYAEERLKFNPELEKSAS